MNPNKTDMIHTGTRPNIKKTKNFEVSFKDETLVPSLSTRLLGVTIDPFLFWEDHISQIVRKCNGILTRAWPGSQPNAIDRGEYNAPPG